MATIIYSLSIISVIVLPLLVFADAYQDYKEQRQRNIKQYGRADGWND